MRPRKVETAAVRRLTIQEAHKLQHKNIKQKALKLPVTGASMSIIVSSFLKNSEPSLIILRATYRNAINLMIKLEAI